MGPVYYQKLKHMVLDKMHARAKVRLILFLIDELMYITLLIKYMICLQFFRDQELF